MAAWFGDITEKEKSEVHTLDDCYTSTTVNLATAQRFFTRIFSLESTEMLGSEHHLITALSVKSWPGVLQLNQKHIKGWNIGLEAEMGFAVSEAFSLPMNAKSLVGLVMANFYGIHYPLQFAMVEASNQRVMIDQALVCTAANNVTSLASAAEENVGSSTRTQGGGLE